VKGAVDLIACSSPWDSPNTSDYASCRNFLLTIQLITSKLGKLKKGRSAFRKKKRKKKTSTWK